MAAMKVDVRHVDDVIIVDLEGRLVMGVGDELLRDVMNELVAEDWKKILLNLRKVSIIDSSGIGEVVSGWKLAGRFGALVKLLRPAPQVERTLKLTQLLPLLEVYDDEGEATSAPRQDWCGVSKASLRPNTTPIVAGYTGPTDGPE